MSVRINPDKCIACTTCVVHCPVAEATPKFLGPRMIGPAYERFRLLGLAEDPSLHYCANCKNCDISCPHDVPVSSINMLARAEQCKQQSPGLRDWVLAHGELQARWLRLIPAGLKNFGMLNPVTRALLDALGIDKRAPLPRFAAQTFRQQMRNTRQPAQTRKAVFFPGCYVDVYDPRTGLDMVWALNRAGYEVIVPDDFVCCGLPMIANGFWQDARANADRNLAALARWREQGIPVITGCPSCALMFRTDLPEFFPDLAEKHGATPLEDAQEFLLDCADCNWTPKRQAPACPNCASSTTRPAICAPRATACRVWSCCAACRASWSGMPMPGAAASPAVMVSKKKNTTSARRSARLFSKPCAKAGPISPLPNAAPAACRFCTAAACPACTP